MIEIGDKLTFNVICVNHHKEGYCFILENCKIKDNFDFNVKLSQTDTKYNQQVLEILERCKHKSIWKSFCKCVRGIFSKK